MPTWFLILACILIWGIAAFLMKIAGRNLDAYTATVFTLPGYLIVTALIASKANCSFSRHHWLVMAVGALYVLGNLAFYRLCETVEISRLAPITAIYVAIPVILGCVVLREPITGQKILGILFAMVALYLLSASAKPA